MSHDTQHQLFASCHAVYTTVLRFGTGKSFNVYKYLMLTKAAFIWSKYSKTLILWNIINIYNLKQISMIYDGKAEFGA